MEIREYSDAVALGLNNRGDNGDGDPQEKPTTTPEKREEQQEGQKAKPPERSTERPTQLPDPIPSRTQTAVEKTAPLGSEQALTRSDE